MIFAVTRRAGSAWVSARPLREQQGWPEHAAFMEALAEDGFVVLAGPIGGAAFHRALIVVEAAGEDEVRARLAEDPWTRSDVLATSAVEPWEILVGAASNR